MDQLHILSREYIKPENEIGDLFTDKYDRQPLIMYFYRASDLGSEGGIGNRTHRLQCKITGRLEWVCARFGKRVSPIMANSGWTALGSCNNIIIRTICPQYEEEDNQVFLSCIGTNGGGQNEAAAIKRTGGSIIIV